MAGRKAASADEEAVAAISLNFRYWALQETFSSPIQAQKRNLPKLSCNFDVMREFEDKSPSLTT
jgi:hypothetical protein